jgi:hypothetical protein
MAHIKTNNQMETKKEIDYKLVNEAFEREGWVKYIQFMAGSKYVKGNDTVTCYFGHFRLNGKSVSEAYICEMLHLGDKRTIQVCGAIAPDSIFSKYGQAFLAGVRWADEHPINKQEEKEKN